MDDKWEKLKTQLKHWIETDEPGAESQAAIEYVLNKMMPDIERAHIRSISSAMKGLTFRSGDERDEYT